MYDSNFLKCILPIETNGEKLSLNNMVSVYSLSG